jgi:hypothetical protein
MLGHRNYRDDSRLWFCPKCGHRWEARVVRTSARWRHYQRLGCGLVAISLLAFVLCALKILGRL